jgi:uncharacterized protein
MQYKQLNAGRERVFAVVFDAGDEFSEGIREFAEREKITAAHFTAIGALSKATLAWFDPDAQEYEKHAVNEQVEVLSLVGNIAQHEGKPKVHAHAVLGKRDVTTVGGHLLKAHVRPTLEVIVSESPLHLHRVHDPKTGLALIRPEAADLPPRRGRSPSAGVSTRTDAPHRAEDDAGATGAGSTGAGGEREGVGMGMGFAIHKPDNATDWKECPNCQMWVHGLDTSPCPNCGYVFAETAAAR